MDYILRHKAMVGAGVVLAAGMAVAVRAGMSTARSTENLSHQNGNKLELQREGEALTKAREIMGLASRRKALENSTEELNRAEFAANGNPAPEMRAMCTRTQKDHRDLQTTEH